MVLKLSFHIYLYVYIYVLVFILTHTCMYVNKVCQNFFSGYDAVHVNISAIFTLCHDYSDTKTSQKVSSRSTIDGFFVVQSHSSVCHLHSVYTDCHSPLLLQYYYTNISNYNKNIWLPLAMQTRRNWQKTPSATNSKMCF